MSNWVEGTVRFFRGSWTSWVSQFWLAVFWLSLRRLRRSARQLSQRTCANRTTIVVHHGFLELTVVFRDTRQPDGFSREELVEMLRQVRRHERRQGWRVPEEDSAARSPTNGRTS